MEELLLQNSKNLTALIHLMKLHEENVARLSSPEDTDVFMKPQLYIECDYSTITSPIYKACPIAREYFLPTDRVIVVRECGHIFKKESFFEWISRHTNCYRCKSRLVS